MLRTSPFPLFCPPLPKAPSQSPTSWLLPRPLHRRSAPRITTRHHPFRATTTSPRAPSAPGSAPASATRIWLPDAAHTHCLGALLGRDSRRGDVILLSGGLGAGKTALARGYVRAACKDATLEVTSPTYLLVNTYVPEGQGATVYHMDLWRLEDARKRRFADLERVFKEEVALVEWPDRLKGAVPEGRLEVLLEYPDGDKGEEGEVDEDDPWGFGSGDPDDVGRGRDGRYATLMPMGTSWEQRVTRAIEDGARFNEGGQLVLREVK